MHLQHYKGQVALLAAFFFLFTLIAGAAPAAVAGGDGYRFAGANRHRTAIEIAHELYPASAKDVVITEARHLADSMVGNLLAGALDAPILLADTVDARNNFVDLKQALIDLRAVNVYILGGLTAVSKELENELNRNYAVRRVAGDNRWATSVEVIKEAATKKTLGTTLYVANSTGTAEAYALAPGAAVAGDLNPVLLVSNNWNTAAKVDQYMPDLPALNVNKIIILGHVDNAVVQALQARYAPVPDLVTGDVYQVAAQLAQASGLGNIVLVNGSDPADALAGGLFAAKKGAAMLLVQKDGLSDIASTIARGLVAGGGSVFVLGGPNAVADQVVGKVIAGGSGEPGELSDFKVVEIF